MQTSDANMGDPILDAEAGPPESRWRWVHLCYSARTEEVLRSGLSLPDELVDVMLERDTLPRVLSVEGQTVLILRGINQLEGSEPEDMISLRLAISAERIVSLEFRRLRHVSRMLETVRTGHAPETPGAFVTQLVALLRMDVEPVLDALERDIDRLERRLLSTGTQFRRSERAVLIDARQDAIQLIRYLSPQAHALETLTALKPGWLGQRRRLRTEAAAYARIAADLEAVRQRAQLVAEEASSAAVESTNKIMMTLSMVSVVFLPITALTGLLGVNLEGIPYADQPWSFAVFCLLLAVALGVSIWVAMRMLR